MKRFLYYALMAVICATLESCEKDYEIMPPPNHGNAPVGAIDGIFSVSSSKIVYFSQGNLQYQASTNTWRFAAQQYYCIGDANENISSSYSGWIDLFGWGTGNNPTKFIKDDSDYFTFSDWGNKVGDDWRTLTKNEWEYVFEDRADASSKYGHGKVAGVCGMILLPDSWTMPSGLNFTPGKSSWANVYTPEQWAKMEANGAVFLPAAGRRSGTSVVSVSHDGYYWSASSNDSYSAYYVDFGSGYLGTWFPARFYGCSVRLVAPAEN